MVGLGSAVSFPVGSGSEPQRRSNLVHFSFKFWCHQFCDAFHKTLVIDLVTYVQNILQPSFVGPKHLPTMPKPQSGSTAAGTDLVGSW